MEGDFKVGAVANFERGREDAPVESQCDVCEVVYK